MSLDNLIYILDDQKNFQFKKRRIGIENKKYANKLEIKTAWKQVKDGAQGSYRTKG